MFAVVLGQVAFLRHEVRRNKPPKLVVLAVAVRDVIKLRRIFEKTIRRFLSYESRPYGKTAFLSCNVYTVTDRSQDIIFRYDAVNTPVKPGQLNLKQDDVDSP